MGSESSTVRLVGSRVRRVEDKDLLVGEAKFIDDITAPNLGYMAVLRSPHAHAELKAASVKEAVTRPGVLGVFTGKDVSSTPMYYFLGGENPNLKTYSCHALAVDRVRYYGEPVAAVVASSREAAEDALEWIEVEYSPLPVVLDAEEAMRTTAPRLYAEWGDNIMLTSHLEGGNIDQAFSRAEHVVKATISIHRHSAAPLETRGYLASYDALSGELVIWATTQSPFVLRTCLARTLGLDESHVRVMTPEIGGSFGPKMPWYHEELLVSLFAMKLGRPVKYVESRNESLQAMHQSREQTHHLELAVSEDWKILGIRDRIIGDVGAFFPTVGPFSLVTAARLIPGCYDVSNYSADVFAVVTNKTPYDQYRGYGKDAACYVIERAMDIAARKLGIDRVEFRLRNLIKPEQLPYRSATGALYDSGDYPESLRRALKLIGYEELKGKQAELRTKGRHIGVGFAIGLEPASGHEGAPFHLSHDGALIRLDPTGGVVVSTGELATGQGQKTVFAQIVADELGVSLDRIRVIQGDTDLVPFGFGTWASRSSVVGANAVLAAARKVKAKMIAIAASALSVAPDELIVENGRICSKRKPTDFVTVQEVIEAAYGLTIPRTKKNLPASIEPGLIEVAYYLTPNTDLIPREGGRKNQYATYGYSTQVAVVEVDIETGQLRVLRHGVVHDCGKMLNPLIVEGQLQGGIAQGLGGALMEENVYDENGVQLTTTFSDYLIPTSMEVPEIEVEHMETPSPFVPLGAKGVGEAGIQGVMATIVNAVEDALSDYNVDIIETPLTPDRLWQAIDSKRQN